MLSLPATLAAELESQTHKGLFRLLEIELDDGTIYRTDAARPITFNGNTYVPDEFTFGKITATTAQQSPRFPLTMQNREHPSTGDDYPWSALLTTALNGVKATVRLVMLSNLSDTTSQISEVDWRINNPGTADDDVQFAVGPPHDIYQLETPWPRLKQARCTHEWKDEGCASESTRFTSCPGKTVQECGPRHTQLALRISQLPIHDRSLYRRRA